ncbi:hypothetical protein EJ08DRAFT_584590 [Tothia fuscella]|uniref:Ubiquitin-like domain-containing protein n=1 Tax=Tothia fuscella TaxID=1048955 RepID=A0A9P4NWZ7_9PEZI|nr:hypothetical protein EJ08DRAFT_584590 [Tothia fuscella]
MPITFGAVGDIISVSLIVKDLLLALDKSRGSSAEYEGIVRELLVLDTALLRVDQLSRTRDATPQLHALYETARQTVQKCRESVDKFKDRNKKFDVFLAGGGSGNWGRDTARKIQWKASGRDEEVVKFRAEISGYTNSIHLLLATANITALDISDHKHSEAKLKIEQASDKQSQTLIEVQSKLEENRQLIITNAVTGESILERVKWIRNLGADLKSLVQSVILGNSTIYKEVMALHQAFRSRVDYSLSEEFFILEDPIGRIAPIHLRFITSWEALDAVMKVRFEGHPEGMDKIRRKQYLIHQDATGFKVDTRRKLEQAILPGQKVTMSVTFHEMERPQHQNLAHCPNCSKVTEASNDVSIVW